jgi:hypothetical protein
MKIIEDILLSDYFNNTPPVLIDIGASGEINAKWKPIASYSACIAFDADDRDFRIEEDMNKGYKKLITVNRIVTAGPVSNQTFYLTSSPYCSSLLEPDENKLSPWLFKSLFQVEKIITLPSTIIQEALKEAGLSYIDWFKSDTQGTDLRLFKNLPGEIADGILATEFEPGIIDTYKGEDKLHMIMQEMDQGKFWLSTMQVKGTQRLNPGYLNKIGPSFAKRVIRRSPCWAEVTYLRQPFCNATQRQLLLLIVFALLEKQFGFALEVADYALAKFDDSIFKTCRQSVLKKIKTEKWKIPLVILKRQFNKVFSNIND